jgi:hypothetical protein
MEERNFIMAAKRLVLGRYSIGIGDRFCMEGKAQLRALKKALDKGVEIHPVWNKSNREHTIIGTEPISTRQEADAAVKEEHWEFPYFVDADHIGLKTVDRFLSASDFYTLDVADFIGKPASAEEAEKFIEEMTPVLGTLTHPALDQQISLTAQDLRAFTAKYLLGLQEATKIYEYLKTKKGAGNFITEVSVDEATQPQSPAELYLFLAGLAKKGVAVQTVAPKFSGAFLKGIDYVGDVNAFSKEFKSDIAVVDIAKKAFGLPEDLKLSIHSGSDKFSLYPHIYAHLTKYNAGVHLKTAGTTWLEEVIGLAADANGLAIAKKIYEQAFVRIEELRKPYETVVDINTANLPLPAAVDKWSSAEYVATLKHVQSNPKFNRDFRQLVHISFRVAAEMGDEYKNSLIKSRKSIEENVTENLYVRHIQPLFLGEK